MFHSKIVLRTVLRYSRYSQSCLMCFFDGEELLGTQVNTHVLPCTLYFQLSYLKHIIALVTCNPRERFHANLSTNYT